MWNSNNSNKEMSKIVDIFSFNGEYDLLEIRLNILNDYVDEFIIVEATETFSGKPKELYYEKQKERFAKWQDKIKYFVVRPPYEAGIVVLANESPNTRGAEHWKREFCQKESIKQALTHLKDEDIVFIGDVDEIVEPIFYDSPTDSHRLIKYKLRVYTYWLNNRSSEPFWGTISDKYGNIKNECLNHLRGNGEGKNTINECGWHFTSLKDGLERKLTDSYTKETYANDWVMNNLEENIKNNKDFLGRDFTFKEDVSEWPEWLKNNRHLYKHLLK